MDDVHVADLRMRNLRLSGLPVEDPVEVVRWLGAVQSQEFGPAKWSIAERLGKPSTDAAISALFNEGTILRTHVLRPTWHFVLPEDIVWMLELTGPRVRQTMTSRHRRLGLDATVMKRCNRLIERALRGAGQMTRQELRGVLAKGRVDVTDAQRLNHIVMNAELTGVICSGPVTGKKQTYALLEERARDARSLTADDALAELTLRYFTSHGPATVKDFAWWSSLTLAQIRRGLEMVASKLTSDTSGAFTYWFSPTSVRGRTSPPRAHLLQPYDEYVVGYTQSRSTLDRAGVTRTNPAIVLSGAVLIDGQVAGAYKRKLSTEAVRVEATLFRPLDRVETRAFEDAAERLGRFLGLRCDLVTTGS